MPVSVAERAQIAPDVGERLRREVDDLRARLERREHARDVVARRRADLTEILRENQIRRRATRSSVSSTAYRLSPLRELAHDGVVDLARAERRELERGRTTTGLPRTDSREVALVRDADELRFEAERARHLGRGRKKRDDALRAAGVRHARVGQSATNAV